MKNILILGANAAIAEACAQLWAEEACAFYLMGRNAERLQLLQSDLLLRGATQVVCQCVDFTEASDRHAMCLSVVQQMGSIDIALLAYGVLGDLSQAKDTRTILEVNMVSALLWLEALAECMPPQSTLAVLGSVAGLRGRASNPVYGASKAGLMVYLQGLRTQLYTRKVHVLTVLPGPVESPMTVHLQKNALWTRPARVARDIDRAIRKQQDICYTPWYWYWIMRIVRWIPERYFKKLSI